MRESSAEIYNYYKMEPNASEIHKNDFLMHDLEPCSVLYSSKMGRVVLVQNRRTKRRYVMKYVYRWKLVKFTEDEKLLKILYTLGRFVGATHQKNMDGFAKYYSLQESSTFVIFMMEFYQSPPLTQVRQPALPHAQEQNPLRTHLQESAHCSRKCTRCPARQQKSPPE